MYANHLFWEGVGGSWVERYGPTNVYGKNGDNKIISTLVLKPRVEKKKLAIRWSACSRVSEWRGCYQASRGRIDHKEDQMGPTGLAVIYY